jgi:hypothetical protein
LGSDVADVFPPNEVVGDAPNEGPEGKERQQKGCKGQGAGAPAASLLILHDAERSEHDPARILGDSAVAAGLFARERSKQVAVGGARGRS